MSRAFNIKYFIRLQFLLKFKNHAELQFGTQLCSPRERGEKDGKERSTSMFHSSENIYVCLRKQ